MLTECNVWTSFISGIFDLDNFWEITSVVSALAVTLAFHTAISEQK